MSAGVELLRRAAAQLRELVEVLPEDFSGPWHVTIVDLGMTAVGDVGRRRVVETYSEAVAEYMATLHAPVALALASWLDRAADDLEQLIVAASGSTLAGLLAGNPESRFAEAIEVARAVLRVEVDSPAGEPVTRRVEAYVPPGEALG